MLFRTREKPKYLNDEIVGEVAEKGFSVYNYVSLKELILTFRKDFLDILSKINIPFAVISIILGIFSYYSSAWFLLFSFLFISYSIIFLIIFVKLLFRTKLFLYVSDVVFTKTGLMISDDFLYYKKDREKIDEKLEKYSQIFMEYLSKPSRLEEVISKKRKEVLDSSMKNSGKFTEVIARLGRSREGGGIALALIISMFLYIASLYVFYYIGYFFIFILSKVYIFFLNIILSFKDNTELKIKNKTIKIEEKLVKMQNIYKILKIKIEEFKSGEISNIGDFVEDKFLDFYTQIDLIIKEKNILKNIILDSKYNDFIDFEIFKKYLKKEFNKPVKDMIGLLEKYEKLLDKQINEFNKLSPHLASPKGIGIKQKLDINNTEILDKNLEKKEFVLNDKLRILRENKRMLEGSVL